jgi:peptidoglycan hydrolase-like protein with peptidoglycan-binding domain
MSTVQHGSQGSLVTALQEALREQGYNLDVDGVFGDDTYNAVRDFQANNDLDVDGVAGPDTFGALGIEVSHHKSRRSDVEYLEHGSRGSSVRALQQALVNAGYDIAVDGDFGDDTYNAVADLQSNNGLSADGIVGPDTWAVVEQFMS